MATSHFYRHRGALGALVLLACSTPGAAQKGTGTPTLSPPKRPSIPVAQAPASPEGHFLRTYCAKCHADGAHKGGFTIDDLIANPRAPRHVDAWQEAMDQIAQGNMPPEDQFLPRPEDKRAFANWVDNNVFAGMCRSANPGRIVARRLNRTEYNNTLSDLLGVPLDLESELPRDASAFGFDNIAESLTTSPLLMERYLEAADVALDRVIFDPARNKRQRRTLRANALGTNHQALQIAGGKILLSTRLDATLTWIAQENSPNRYKISVQAAPSFTAPLQQWRRESGPKRGKPRRAAPMLVVTIDNREVWRGPLQGQGLRTYDLLVDVPVGRHRIDFVAKAPDDKADKVVGHALVSTVTIDGPLAPPTEPSAAHRAMFFAAYDNDRDEAAAKQILQRFARRALRRPVDDADVDRLMPLVTEAWEQGADFHKGVRQGLRAILVSARFLFRLDLIDELEADRPYAPIDEHALASRLSYFLWSTMPDDALMEAADAGTLRDNLDAHIATMLADPRAHALAENFGGQWLQFRKLHEVRPAWMVFKHYTAKLRAAYGKETLMFFEHVMGADQSVMDFVNADYTFANEDLAKHYGIADVTGEAFRKVPLGDLPRRGVLTHGSILTLTSRPIRTSPAMRGKWVLDTFLGIPPPPPPPDIPDLPSDQDMEQKRQTTTLRSRLEAHRDNPVCASCHARFDPIGFGLENFDGIGVYRTTDATQPVDAHGTLNTGESFDGPLALIEILATSKKDFFLNTFATKLFTYAMGREPRNADRCSVKRIVQEAEKNDLRFSSFVKGVVTSQVFLNNANPTLAEAP